MTYEIFNSSRPFFRPLRSEDNQFGTFSVGVAAGYDHGKFVVSGTVRVAGNGDYEYQVSLVLDAASHRIVGREAVPTNRTWVYAAAIESANEMDRDQLVLAVIDFMRSESWEFDHDRTVALLESKADQVVTA